MDAQSLSQELLYSVKRKTAFKSYVDLLAKMKADNLLAQLNNEDKKLSFWINIYNAFIQINASSDPQLIKDKKTLFFSKKSMVIAQHRLSFNDIEHGILRRSKIMISLGYLNKPAWFVPAFEKQFRIKRLDCRIHFALNCAAKSCPPIAFYRADNIDQQLNLATSSFLTSSVRVEKNTVWVSKIFLWFYADFGGKKGILNLLKEHDILTEHAEPKLKFKPYDWSLSLADYTE